MILLGLPTSNPGTIERLMKASAREGWQLSHQKVATLQDIRAIHASGQGVAAVCAAAILIRAVAPVLQDKSKTPPLVAIANDGSAVVPLIGCHHGANDWAIRFARVFDVAPAITTASDVSLGFVFEQAPAGFAMVSSASQHKTFVARVLRGAGIRVFCELPKAWLPPLAPLLDAVQRLNRENLNGENRAGILENRPQFQDQEFRDQVNLFIGETAEQLKQARKQIDLAYLAKNISIGVGTSRNCPSDELAELVISSLDRSGCHRACVCAMASHELKQTETAVLELSKTLGIPVHFYASERLNRHKAALSQTSAVVFRETGVWGVAESAALELSEALSGKQDHSATALNDPNSPEPVKKETKAGTCTLLLTKQKSAMATCSLARFLL